MSGFEGVSLHVASWCNWLLDLGSLSFYDCFDDSLEVSKPKKRKSRRRSKRETEEEYEIRVRDWEVRQPHEPKIAGRSNSMTQQYYRDILLSDLCDVVLDLQRKYGRGILQKDNNSSHGTRPNKAKKTDNVCEAYRKERGVETLKHPAQSPDLNCHEGIWNIFMVRLRREPRPLGTKAELKQICLKVWSTITLAEVRARIEEMPWRCKEVQLREGVGIKSYLW